MEALTTRIDSQFKEIKGDMKEMRDGCKKCRRSHISSDCDDKPLGGPKEEEANYASGGYRGNYYGQNSGNWCNRQSHYGDENQRLNPNEENPPIPHLPKKKPDESEFEKTMREFIVAQKASNHFTYDPPVNPNAKPAVFLDDSEDKAKEVEKEAEPLPKKPTHADPPPLKAYKPKIPYPQRLHKEKMEARYAKFLDMIKEVRINVPLVDVLAGMPNYGKFLKDLVSNKSKMEKISVAFLTEECSAILQNKLPSKLGDPRSFLIPCKFANSVEYLALADLGASINLMPYSLYTALSGTTLKPTRMSIRLANHTYQYTMGVTENMLVQVGKFIFPVDFVIYKWRKIIEEDRATILIDKAMQHSHLNNDTCFRMDVIDEVIEDELDALLDNSKPFLNNFEELPPKDELRIKTSIQDPPIDLEMKPLPKHLEYAFLEENSHLPVEAFAWKTSDILRISPSFCKHKINFEDDVKPITQRQRRLNPKMKEVVKKEIIKLLDAGIIYAIEDSPWLNEATRKDHFPLPFMDHMLERLAGNKFFCFLDGFSGYFQIPIEPADQEKTTFACPYGTYAYKDIPFGLCNTPATFQRCMIAIFQDMLETYIEVFMDDFSVFGDSFDSCLTNLEQMLIRCKQAHLVLNWEKSHFMVTEGILLGHKVSSKGLEVEKAKIDVIAKLPPPTNIKAVRSFLGHPGFYRRFIKYFSKISRPMTKLLEKDSVFNFDEECNKAFETLKEKLTNAPIMVSPNWSLPFELMEEEINDEFPDEFLMGISTDKKESSWFADFANYLVGGILRKGLTYPQRYVFTVRKLKKFSMNVIMDPLVDIMDLRLLQRKFLMLDFIGQPYSKKHKLSYKTMTPANGIDFMGPFLKSHKFEYILVTIDYVSKWAEAEALPTNDARVVVNFLKKLFSRFGILKALISNRGTHFCNRQMEKILKKYGVHHRITTAYHPQTSGQVENTNRTLKRILKKTIKDNPSIWLRKLDDALWEFYTAYKTLTGTTPYQLLYGKMCRLPFEIKHRAYWALRIKHGYPSGYVELYDEHRGSFIVNGQCVKLYHDEEQLNELTTEEIHLMCEEGRMKAIPIMAPFPTNYRETMPWASEKPYIYTVVENTCNDAKMYDLDETGKGIVIENILYQKKLNLTQPNWDATDFLFKEDYTIVHKPRALDFMVKDYELFKFNLGMEKRIWTEDDKWRSQEFIKLIKRRLKIRRIFRSLKSFVGGRLRDVDYRLINRTE
ncbi:reverse transcriptase domain-containing protein [Tanacetum coccineum]